VPTNESGGCWTEEQERRLKDCLDGEIDSILEAKIYCRALETQNNFLSTRLRTISKTRRKDILATLFEELDDDEKNELTSVLSGGPTLAPALSEVSQWSSEDSNSSRSLFELESGDESTVGSKQNNIDTDLLDEASDEDSSIGENAVDGDQASLPGKMVSDGEESSDSDGKTLDDRVDQGTIKYVCCVVSHSAQLTLFSFFQIMTTHLRSRMTVLQVAIVQSTILQVTWMTLL
jgi:hypothetical protein